METQENCIDIYAVELDQPARIHEAFLRSLRILRAFVGYLVFVCIMAVPSFVFWTFYDYGINWANLVSIAWFVPLLFACFAFALHIFFYVFRSVAAGSLGTTRCVVAITCLALVNELLMLRYYIFEFT